MEDVIVEEILQTAWGEIRLVYLDQGRGLSDGINVTCSYRVIGTD